MAFSFVRWNFIPTLSKNIRAQFEATKRPVAQNPKLGADDGGNSVF